MKLCYKAILDVFEEIEEKMCKEGKLYVHYAKVRYATINSLETTFSPYVFIL